MDPVIAVIDSEIARLQQIRSMLAESPAKRGLGRPSKKAIALTSVPKKKRTLSKEARQRIRDAQNKRWAAVKKAKKPTVDVKKSTKTAK